MNLVGDQVGVVIPSSALAEAENLWRATINENGLTSDEHSQDSGGDRSDAALATSRSE